MALTASPQSALRSGPSWDETIVPSLRKRLQTESRILSKRLSTISINDEGQPLDSRPATPPQDNSQKPSAIPRPSYVSRPTASPPSESLRKPGRPRRQRTLSTPFPFNDPASPTLNGQTVVSPASPSQTASDSTSPRLQSPALSRPAPSRIPTVSGRTRSGSHSSQNVVAKSTVQQNYSLPTPGPPSEAVSPVASLAGKSSSSSLTRQRIVDERPPFTHEPSPHVLEREFTGRASAEEERTYQHWYRGDVSRNGGVGEYRVGKRMEMLDIANYGHPPRDTTMRTRAYEEPIPRSEAHGSERKRAESVSSRERASIYIDSQDDGGVDRVLDETPLTDIETDEVYYDNEQYAELPTEFGMHQIRQPQVQQYQKPNGAVQTSPTNHNRQHSEVKEVASLPTRLQSVKPQSRIPHPQVRSQPRKGSVSSSAAVSEPPTPTKSNPSDRGRSQPNKQTRTKPAAKTKTRPEKRSKSAGGSLQSAHEMRESVDYGLADAVPETSSPKPRDGNWDEVILPTVARRMGIEYEKEDPVTTAKKNAYETRIAPAPGTFGYDHTKYKTPRDEDIPMSEFGQQRPHPVPESRAERVIMTPVQASPPEPKTTALHSRRETMPSRPPFSHYMDSRPSGDGRNKDRQDVSQTLVSPPTAEERATMRVEAAEDAGCCKCVVM